LEQQQGQLVSGLQEMYRRMRQGEPWKGPKLSEATGHPLTHDILAALGLLEAKHDGTGDMETFEEDCERIQSKLIADGAGYVRRRGSFSSDSEHSSHGHSKSTSHSTPAMAAKQPLFDKNFNFSPSPSPVIRSPVPRQRKSYPPAHESPLHRATPMSNEPQLYQAPWPAPNFNEAAELMRASAALKTPQFDQGLEQVNDFLANGQWNDALDPYELGLGINSYQQSFNGGFNQFPGMQDYTMSTMDIDSDFKQFIAV
jgi:hypothetical protein